MNEQRNNSGERFRRFKDRMGLSFVRLGEIFGTDDQTVQQWYSGRHRMSPDYYHTMLRLEAENLPALSPKLKPETIIAFYEGRARNHGVGRGRATSERKARSSAENGKLGGRPRKVVQEQAAIR